MRLPNLSIDLATPRLLLRPIALSDSPSLYEIYSDPETMKYWSSEPLDSLEAARENVRQDVELAASGHAWFWAICLRETGGVIGKCAALNYSAQNLRAEIGYILNRNAWRQGIMREALVAVIDWLFDEPGLHRLERR